MEKQLNTCFSWKILAGFFLNTFMSGFWDGWFNPIAIYITGTDVQLETVGLKALEVVVFALNNPPMFCSRRGNASQPLLGQLSADSAEKPLDRRIRSLSQPFFSDKNILSILYRNRVHMTNITIRCAL